MSACDRHHVSHEFEELPLPPPNGDALSATHIDFALLQDLISDVVFVIEVLPGEVYRFLYANSRFESATGLNIDDVVGRNIDEVIPSQSLPLVKKKYRQAMESGHVIQWDEVSAYPAGTKVGEVTVLPVRHPATGSMLLVGTVHDVTARCLAQAQVTELEERWRLSLDASGAVAWDWDQATNIINFSAQWKELLGKDTTCLPADEPSLRELVHSEDFPVVRDAYRNILADPRARMSFEIRLRHADGHWIWVRCLGRAARGGTHALRVLGTLTDISSLKHSEEALWRQANYDQLTGLPNRNLFLDRMDQAILGARRGAPAFSILYIDLDQFKEINDTLGHGIGDRLLVEAARRMLACARETDTVCRLGGDEFAVLLADMHNAEREDAYVIERIASAILDAMTQPFEIGEEKLHISASIGIAHFPRDADDSEGLLKHVDQAMYEAKRMGRNRFVYFSHQMQDQAQARRRMIDDLRRAVRSGELEVRYQPIVDLRDGTICKAEALLRWNHPERGWISPPEFIALCEETGLIIEIGEWVFKKVVCDTAHWHRSGKWNLKVGLNVSPVQIIHGAESCSRCLDCLAEQHLPRNTIVAEVTETSLLRNDSIVRNQLRTMHDQGVSLALDDFGTGYSALSYLQQYDFQFLKIDRSFVHDVGWNHTKLALCETMITMAHKLDMQVIAEGIENDQEADLLRGVDCDYGQGYRFFRAAPAKQFEAWVEAYGKPASPPGHGRE